MTYKIGHRVRKRFHQVKLIGLGLSVLLIGTLATSYADSQITPIFHYPFQKSKKAIAVSKPMNHSKQKAAGSAHSAAKSNKGAFTSSAGLPKLASLQTASCVMFPPKNPGLAGSLSPQLRKLGQYEQLCNGALVQRASFFTPTPASVSDAKGMADDIAKTLKEFDSVGVKPLVFMEPDDENGNNLDLVAYRNGTYDSALDAYFAQLKADSISDAMMGMWTILPEGNLPVWSSNDPSVYAADVTKTIQFQKKYFPGSQSTILLDSESYAPGASWGSGQYVSLLPFVQGIPKGLVDSFGLQGFPWVPPANQGGDAVYNPSVYLRADFAAQAARSLGVNSIWFNTGTFHQMYTLNSAQTVTDTPQQRQAMLDSVISQARSLQSQGFSIAIHLFAQNKANTAEATDWSYWQISPDSDPNTVVFTNFVHDATVDSIPLWIFDEADGY